MVRRARWEVNMDFLCIVYQTPQGPSTSFSSSFIDGISGTALKKDNVRKHHPAVLELEERVSLGTAYATQHKCKDFTVVIGESTRDDILASVHTLRYLAVL